MVEIEPPTVWSPWEDAPATPAAVAKSSAVLLLDEGVYDHALLLFMGLDHLMHCVSRFW